MSMRCLLHREHSCRSNMLWKSLPRLCTPHWNTTWLNTKQSFNTQKDIINWINSICRKCATNHKCMWDKIPSGVKFFQVLLKLTRSVWSAHWENGVEDWAKDAPHWWIWLVKLWVTFTVSEAIQSTIQKILDCKFSILEGVLAAYVLMMTTNDNKRDVFLDSDTELGHFP